MPTPFPAVLRLRVARTRVFYTLALQAPNPALFDLTHALARHPQDLADGLQRRVHPALTATVRHLDQSLRHVQGTRRKPVVLPRRRSPCQAHPAARQHVEEEMVLAPYVRARTLLVQPPLDAVTSVPRPPRFRRRRWYRSDVLGVRRAAARATSSSLVLDDPEQV